MTKRVKRLIKQREGLLEQAMKHQQKIETEKGRKNTTHEYWRGEMERFRKQAEERDKLLKKQFKKGIKDLKSGRVRRVA